MRARRHRLLPTFFVSSHRSRWIYSDGDSWRPAQHKCRECRLCTCYSSKAFNNGPCLKILTQLSANYMLFSCRTPCYYVGAGRWWISLGGFYRLYTSLVVTLLLSQLTFAWNAINFFKRRDIFLRNNYRLICIRRCTSIRWRMVTRLSPSANPSCSRYNFNFYSEIQFLFFLKKEDR